MSRIYTRRYKHVIFLIACIALTYLMPTSVSAEDFSPEPPKKVSDRSVRKPTKFGERIYNAKGWLIGETDAAGGVIEYRHDERGNAILKRQKLSEGEWAETGREFDSWNRLIREYGPEGEETRYLRDERGLSHYVLTKVDDGCWSANCYEYDAKGNITLKSTSYFVNDSNRPEIDRPSTAIRYGYDQSGNLIFVIDPVDGVTNYEYDEDNRLIAETSPKGLTTEYEYDDFKGILRIVDATGGSVEWACDDEGNPFGPLLPTAEPTEDTPEQYVFSERNQLISRSDPAGRTTRYEYDKRGQQTKEIDSAGNIREYLYNQADQIIAVFDPNGVKTVFEYDNAGNMTSATDGEGAKTEMIYDLAGRLLRVVKPGGGVEEYVYDRSARLIRHRVKASDSEWRETRFAYNLRGEVVRIALADDTVLTFAYGPSGESLASTLDPDGLAIAWKAEHDALGRVVREIDPLGNAVSYAYDPDSNLVGMTSPEGRRAAFAYDALGRLHELVLDPEGIRQTYSLDYDAFGNVVRESNGLTETKYEYYESGLLHTFARSGRAPVLFEYDKAGRFSGFSYKAPGEEIAERRDFDPVGNVLRSVNAEGGEIEYQYNRNNRATKIANQLGAVAEFAYDAEGRVTSALLPEMNAITYDYDLTGSLVSMNGGPAGKVEYRYDQLGRRIAAVDANGRNRSIAYDRAGRVVRAEDPLGNAVLFEYDAAGRRTAFTDANGNRTEYTYDRDGLLLSVRFPSVPNHPENVLQYEYDAAGRMHCETTPNGIVIRSRFDTAGNIAVAYTGEHIPAPQPIPDENLLIAYERDAAGMVTAERDSRTTLRYKYDDFGRLREVRDTSLRQTLRFEYDRRGLRTAMQLVEDGRATLRSLILLAVRYEYDAAGQLVSVRQDDDFAFHFGYDSLGRRRFLERPNQVLTEYSYDSSGRLSDISTSRLGTILERFAYEHDAGGMRVGVTYADGGRNEYGMDGAYRLLRDRRLDADGKVIYEDTFSYDAVGNRIRRSTSDGETLYEYNSRNQLISTRTKDENEEYRYDNSGNLIERIADNDKEEYSYDALERLIKYTGPKGTEENEYYGISRQRSRITTSTKDSSDTLRLFYDGDNALFDYEVTGSSRASLISSYLAPFLDENLTLTKYRDTRSTVSYYTQDGLGSVRSVRDRYGDADASYDYRAYGERFGEDRNSLTQRYGFTGRETSSVSPHQFSRFRNYDTSSGRFLSRDPLRYFANHSGNLYGYVNGIPQMYLDPYGLWDWGGFWQGIKAVALEPLNAASDIALTLGAKAWDIPLEHIQYASMSAKGSQQRLLSGQNTWDSFGNGMKDMLVAMGTLGGYPVYIEMSSAVADFEAGLITFEEMDRRISAAAGSMTGAAGMGLLAKVGGRTQIGRRIANTELPSLKVLDAAKGWVGNRVINPIKNLIPESVRNTLGNASRWLSEHSILNRILDKYFPSTKPGGTATGLIRRTEDAKAAAEKTVAQSNCPPESMLGKTKPRRGNDAHNRAQHEQYKNELRIQETKGEGRVSLIDETARRHILDGDLEGGGGHRGGTGRPDKTEFPSNWSDGKILEYISDIATDPKSIWGPTNSRGYRVTTMRREGIDIRVVFDSKQGRVVTGFPVNLPRNP